MKLPRGLPTAAMVLAASNTPHSGYSAPLMYWKQLVKNIIAAAPSGIWMGVTDAMVDAGAKVDPNDHASQGSWVEAVLEAALAASPTVPAEEYCEDEGCQHHGIKHICISTSTERNIAAKITSIQYLNGVITLKILDNREVPQSMDAGDVVTLVPSGKADHPPAKPNAAVAAIKFALSHYHEDPMVFLQLWNEGNFAVIRREWEDVPDEVFTGEDSLAPVSQVSETPTVIGYIHPSDVGHHLRITSERLTNEQLQVWAGTLPTEGY